MRLALVCLVVIFSSLLLAAEPRPEMNSCDGWFKALGRGLSSKDYATLEVHRANNATISYINIELLRTDFPQLNQKSDDDIRGWVIDNYAYVSKHANDNAEIHHSGISVNPEDNRQAVVPHTYGRAFLLEAKDGNALIDMKGIGVTYVEKNKRTGQVELNPSRVTFEEGANHQNGLMTQGESLFEANAGETLQGLIGKDGKGANQTYFILNLGAEVYQREHADGAQSDPAVILGRQPNVRFYRLDASISTKARDEFLYTNAKLFWRGFYHGSMNRYNADNGIYIDFGTVGGVPERSYRLTAMTYVPYGLSDFYGLFGEWSAGQATNANQNLSPFHARSWNVFLANLGVAMGLDASQTVQLTKLNKRLGKKDLHEYLIDINQHKDPVYRDDPTRSTYSQMDLIRLTQDGVHGAEQLETAVSSIEIYREIIRRAKTPLQSPVLVYKQLLTRAAPSGDPSAILALANKLAKVEGLIRSSRLGNLASATPETLGAHFIGEQLLRPRLNREAYDTQGLYHQDPTEGPALSYLNRYRRRIERSSPPKPDAQGNTSPTKMEQLVHSISSSGNIAAYLTRITAPGLDRDLPILVPTAESLLDSEMQSILNNSVGFIWRDTRAAGEQYGHALIRVGWRVYDLQVAQTFAHDFYDLMKSRFFYDFGMKSRSGQAPYYETTFAVSTEARDTLIRYFEARTKGTATIDGQVTVPRFSVDAAGEIAADGTIEENCGAFVWSIAHPRWWKDYPGLEQAAKQVGLTYLNDGAHVGMEAALDPNTKPLAFISWSGSFGLNSPFEQHRALQITNMDYDVEIVQKWPLKLNHAKFRSEADQMRAWAMSQGMSGFQSSIASPLSKSGELMGESHRFNFIHLPPNRVRAFTKDITPNHFTIWWRWEGADEFGHILAGAGNQLFDHSPDGYGTWDTLKFFQKEISNEFIDADGDETFLVGLSIKMKPSDIEALRTFYEARRTGKKVDGTPVPMPNYNWDTPFDAQTITDGTCGMFATSFANPKWQKLFPELPLQRISKQYGIKYSDGALFILHRQLHLARTPRNFFVIGSPEHVRQADVPHWELPSDALPNHVQPTLRGAWSALGNRQPFHP